MVYTGTEPQNIKNIQKVPLKSLELFYEENCSKTHFILENDSTLKSGKIGHFARAIVQKKGSREVYFESELKEPKIYKKK